LAASSASHQQHMSFIEEMKSKLIKADDKLWSYYYLTMSYIDQVIKKCVNNIWGRYDKDNSN
jgi:hypothetical protein